MDERSSLAELGLGASPWTPGEDLRLELGSLVAALSAWTENETELDLELRAFIESGAVFVDRAPEDPARITPSRTPSAPAPN